MFTGVCPCLVCETTVIYLWDDDDYYYDDDKLIKWYEGYKKRKSQKAKIKEEEFTHRLAS